MNYCTTFTDSSLPSFNYHLQVQNLLQTCSKKGEEHGEKNCVVAICFKKYLEIFRRRYFENHAS